MTAENISYDAELVAQEVQRARDQLQATPLDQKMMDRVLELARHGIGKTAPNPMVGCVIHNQGGVIAEGYHAAFGELHAEADALNRLDDPTKAEGATVYVNLEPCAHHGKTPPCADALVKAGVGRVVIANLDPFPEVSGHGIAHLAQAGIRVELGLREREGTRLNCGFFMQQTQQRPFVVAKWAMTLDGRIAAISGDSQWISNQTSLRVVHHYRSQVDAIMVGIGTVMRDNPRLNVRLPGYTGRQPWKIIVDSRLRTPLKSQVLKRIEGETGQALLVTSKLAKDSMIDRFHQTGAEVLVVGNKHGMIDMEAVMRELAAIGIQNIMVEGGGQLHGGMLRQNLIDQVVAFIAPKIIGGNAPTNPIEGYGVEYMKDALNLAGMELRMYGGDICMMGFVKKSNALENLYEEGVTDQRVQLMPPVVDVLEKNDA
jgi:diaminohydroxyphosphoribosylaminopyrimidine deaminase/5-amino-6-(5-phosphoribosylamino)uracil reductase